ncbi:MAG: PQQ-dependent sugar dehydrogenase [Candidatus Heimdallarchaeota archaeon]|nr:PQQ-dependent sugar dehydrogenase [Candidatus Heimdallarchaeota archaeon]MDH5645127.1 PQQ-dependent sugar dehydrogenase [Candidatus Heimdallarchaeota archaeon]
MPKKLFGLMIVCLMLLGIQIPITALPLKAGETFSDYKFINAFEGLDIRYPTAFSYGSPDNGYYYVAEYTGKVKVFDKNNPKVMNIFLDLTHKVAAIDEGGFLGLTFHPEFEDNGFFYVFYTILDPDRLSDQTCSPCLKTVISRFQQDNNNPLTADENSELIILNYDLNSRNHVGGNLLFGPDSYLYIQIGDSSTTGQNLNDFFGKILRIDINNQSEGKNYSIPYDNPFNNNTHGYKEEIYAYGFRNPWRGSFDILTGNYWVGDVGATRYEEINIVHKGGNYGWNITEGEYCQDYLPCDTSGIIPPVYTYGHNETDSIDVPYGGAIIGGIVYRGTEFPEFYGDYFFADYAGAVFVMDFDETDYSVTSITKLFHIKYTLSSFATTPNNEFLIVQIYGDSIYKMEELSIIDKIPLSLVVSFVLISTIIILYRVFKKKQKDKI